MTRLRRVGPTDPEVHQRVARLGNQRGDKVFVIMGRVPELYVSMLGALRNGSVVARCSPRSAPMPIATG